MHLIEEDMDELRRQLTKGSIQRAYRALFSYMMELRAHFVNKYGDPAVSGLYQGYMDMMYFALFPPALRRLDLKVAIVFNFDAFKFEAWLAARNRKVQRQIWELVKDSQWAEYRVVAPAGGIDSIIECDLATEFDFSRRDILTSGIENRTSLFINDMERFLFENPPQQREKEPLGQVMSSEG